MCVIYMYHILCGVNSEKDNAVTVVASPLGTEPLVRLSDLDEYRKGLAKRLSNEWDDEKFTGFRTLFGVYGQKQPGVQMIRIKIPGGVVPVEWMTSVAEFNRLFCKGDAHITTRQDFQTYFVPLERSAEALEFLYSHGLTTREACGNTFRNITSCALAGNCPREHVDAGAVAERLARSWIRHPLVQHMPRKVKITVSGCATDCGHSGMHDISFVAIEKDGRQGFQVLVGGGLGGIPRAAIVALDFATEDELSLVVETTARLHQRYSDRVNRNAARIKFVVKRFGEEKFRQLFLEEFDRLRGLPQRPWEPLAWRTPTEAAVARTPQGVVKQHDGRFAVVGNPPLGNLSSDQLDSLVGIAKKIGVSQFRITRDQNIVLPDVAAGQVDEVVRAFEALGIVVPESGEKAADVVSCPGTTTCRIGITNSQGFAREVWEDSKNDVTAHGVAVRVSGCQNSCGMHHVGDFGLHGVAKKVNGEAAPHYQLHLGGDPRNVGQIGILGPVVASRHAVEALRILRHAYAADKQIGETVRGWAERLGKKGVAALLAPLEDKPSDKLFIDVGDDFPFPGAPTLKGECAVPLTSDNTLADLSDDGLIQLDRHLAVNRWEDALKSADDAVAYASRRIIHYRGETTTDEDPHAVIAERLRGVAPAQVASALDQVSAALIAAVSSGKGEAYREAVAVYLDTVRSVVEAPVEAKDAAE